jgi:hypothetical protein
MIKSQKMETIVLKGESKSNARLLLELARKLNFSAKKISSEEAEDIGLYYSIKEGMESGLMAEEEKTMFLLTVDNN